MKKKKKEEREALGGYASKTSDACHSNIKKHERKEYMNEYVNE